MMTECREQKLLFQVREIAPQQEQVKLRCEISGRSARVFTEFSTGRSSRGAPGGE
jgi:hypothetical protein